MEESLYGTLPRIGKRHVQAIMYFFGRIIQFSTKLNLSVGVVAMTSKSNSNALLVDWSTRQIAILSSMAYYGMMMTEFTAGYLLKRFGSSKLVSSAVLLSGLTSIALPYIAVNFGFEATCVLRIINGLGQGVFYPAIITHTAKWAVQAERGLMYTVALSGGSLGSILMLSTGGFIAASPMGWPAIFYIPGALAVMWGVLGFFILRDSPAAHKTISEMERDWIEAGLPDKAIEGNKLLIPWKDILMSGRVWVGILAAFCSQWGYSLSSNLTPTYLQGVLGISISKNGILSCLPYIVAFILCSSSGFASDFLIRREFLSVWDSRRLWTSLGLYGGAIGLLVLGVSSFGEVGVVSILSLAAGAHGLIFSGYLLMGVDLTPNFSGVVNGLQQGFSDIGAICAPTVAGIIVTDKHNTSQWQHMFLLTAAIYIVGCTLYVIFGSAKVQPWNQPKIDSRI